MICNTRSKRVTTYVVLIAGMKYIYIANFHVSFSFGVHYNALFGLIMISNTRSKSVNENLTILCTCPGRKYVYMQIFRFISVSVVEIREFNKKMKKNMAKL